MYKRIVSILLLCALMLTLFTGCSAKRKIQGRWCSDYKIKFKSSTINDKDSYGFINSTTGTYTLVLNSDNEFAISQSLGDDSIREVVAAYKDLYKKIFEEGKSSDEINKLISDASLSDEDALLEELLLTSAKKNGFGSVQDYILADLGIVSKTLITGTYKVSGNNITFFNTSNDKINMTAEYDREDKNIYLSFNGNDLKFEALDLDN